MRTAVPLRPFVNGGQIIRLNAHIDLSPLPCGLPPRTGPANASCVFHRTLINPRVNSRKAVRLDSDAPNGPRGGGPWIFYEGKILLWQYDDEARIIRGWEKIREVCPGRQKDF